MALNAHRPDIAAATNLLYMDVQGAELCSSQKAIDVE